MIFRQIEDIVAGRKTQTRRVIDPDKTTLASEATDGQRYYYNVSAPPFPSIDAIYMTGKDGKLRLKWQVGNVYAMVPKRGAKGVGFYRITSLRVECLQDITEADARAEGILPFGYPDGTMGYACRGVDAAFPTARDCYEALWESINGKYKGARWSDNPWVVVIEIEYVGVTK